MVPTSCVYLRERKIIGGDLGKRKSSAPDRNRGCRAGSPHVWTSAWPWGDRALALVPGQTPWSELPGRGSNSAESAAAAEQWPGEHETAKYAGVQSAKNVALQNSVNN